MPVRRGVGAHHYRGLVHLVLAAPDLQRHGNPVIVVEPYARRHAVGRAAFVERPGDDLAVAVRTALLALPRPAAVERPDKDSAGLRNAVEGFVAVGDVHLYLARGELQHRRFPAAARVDVPRFGEGAALVVAEQDFDAAVFVGVGDVVVALLVAPLVGEQDAPVLQFDEIRVYEYHLVGSRRGAGVETLAHHLRIAPRASAILAAPYEGVPAEVVVHEGHQQRSVRERLDAGVVEFLFGVALVLHGCGGHLLKRAVVPCYAYVAFCHRGAARFRAASRAERRKKNRFEFRGFHRFLYKFTFFYSLFSVCRESYARHVGALQIEVERGGIS